MAALLVGSTERVMAVEKDPATGGGGKKLLIYILAGQSNMQGHASITTFDSLAYDPKTALLLKEMRTADGKPKVCEKKCALGVFMYCEVLSC